MDAPDHRLRGLEILKWGTQHDPDAEYIKRWIPALKSLPGTVAREPWRLGLREESGLAANGGKLRPVPTGKFDISKTQLDQLLTMGFDEKQSAVALYRTWGDVDAAVALIAEGEGALFGAEDEDDDLARALALSMEQPGDQRQEQQPSANGGSPRGDGAFKYGVDYPKPLITPVSLRNTEQEEEEARRAQANRDRQNAGARRPNGGGGRGAGSGKGNFKGSGKRGWSPGGEDSGRNAGAGKDFKGGKGERKRRWGANGQVPEDERIRGA